MPKLTIVIGANGAGKSTWCDKHRSRRLPADFYNADSIAKGLGDWNSPAKQGAAREMVDAAIEQHLQKRSDFGFESTYSGRSRPDIVRRAKALGYETEAVFVGTTRPEINVDRVAKRVAARTGHDVPSREIRRRWTAAQDNLAATATRIDNIELIDNSAGHSRRVMLIHDRQVTDQASRVPKWSRQLAARITARVPTGTIPEGPAEAPASADSGGTGEERKPSWTRSTRGR